MSDLPEPMTPPDCDLRGMPYMPLDIVRLFDSDFYILSTGEEFKSGVTLWGKAFLQVPAGSLADDDRILSHLSGAKSAWPKIKAMALRGWVKCADGRLYHPTVAEKALEAWQARQSQRARTAAARAARAAARSDSTPPPSVTNGHAHDVTASVTETVADNVTGSKGREGKGREEERKKEPPPHPPEPSKPSRSALSVCEPETDFDRFWAAYPRKCSKGQARKAWKTAAAKHPPHAIVSAAMAAQWPDNPRFIPHPATWLAGERWLDEAPPDDREVVLRNLGLLPLAGSLLQ